MQYHINANTVAVTKSSISAYAVSDANARANTNASEGVDRLT
jgi:hypothetical protein